VAGRTEHRSQPGSKPSTLVAIAKKRPFTNMDIKYPFIPKSNSKLKPGHFWPIRLSDGNFACGLVLDVPCDKKKSNSRMFYAALLSWTSALKPTSQSLESSVMKILDQGHAHIKTITIQGEAIEGLIDLKKAKLKIAFLVDSDDYSPNSYVYKGFQIIRKSTRQDHKNLNTQSTWGYNVIISSANQFLT